MDGNGRWATKRGLKRTDGHAAGEEALFDTVEGALELGLRWLTVYAFSTENWRRPDRRGPLPDAVQPGRSSCAGATSCTSAGCGSASPAAATGGCPGG